MIPVGVDPGLEGYVCLLTDEASGEPYRLDFFPCPVAPDQAGEPDFDEVGMLEVANSVVRRGADLVVIEAQQGFPGYGQKCISCGKPRHQQGVASTFKTGRGFGAWKVAFLSTGVRVEVVAPQEWKKPFGLTSDKALSVAKAKEIRPDVDWRARERTPKARKPDHNKCEAFLLAIHGRKLLKREASP